MKNGEIWMKCSEALPKDGIVVRTKIDDENGVRNEQDLIRSGHIWFHTDKQMYVYYKPTHWMLTELSGPRFR